MPRCCYLLHSGAYFGNHKYREPESNVWSRKTRTEQIIDNKWGLLSTHLNLLLITGRRQCRNANEPGLGAVGIHGVSKTSFGKVCIGASIMHTLKSLPAWICSVELSYCSLTSFLCIFRGIFVPPGSLSGLPRCPLSPFCPNFVSTSTEANWRNKLPV